MKIDIPIPKGTGGWYYGRNRSGNLLGLHIDSGDRLVNMRPINSRGITYNCEITVPIDNIPDVIQALIEVHQNA